MAAAAMDRAVYARSYDLLYEDDDLIAVNKPAGLPTLPGAHFLQSTLLYLVRAHAPTLLLSIDWVDGHQASSCARKTRMPGQN